MATTTYEKLSIGIAINKISYSPEAYAYQAFLSKRGYDVQIAAANDLCPLHDIHIYFMGLRPYWQKKGSWKELHEYQSLSTPDFAKLKNALKKRVNAKPDGRIFLNSFVRDELSFVDGIPYIYRDMGVDSALFLSKPKSPQFDLIYCGSIRQGFDVVLLRLADLGLKILVVGQVADALIKGFSRYNNVVFVGRVDRVELPALYSQAKIGLSYTPDVYPFNKQTSTKVLEYCAAGLGVLSNRYAWVESFALHKGFQFLWLDDIKNISAIQNYQPAQFNVNEYCWSQVLEQAHLDNFLKSLVYQ